MKTEKKNYRFQNGRSGKAFHDRRLTSASLNLGIARAPGGGVFEDEANALCAARIDPRKQRGLASPSAAGEELNEARTRRESAKADQARVEADLLVGSVVKIEDVMRIWGQLISPAKTKLMGLGAKLGPMVAVESDAAACKAMIDGAVYAALSEIAEYGATPPPGGR